MCREEIDEEATCDFSAADKDEVALSPDALREQRYTRVSVLACALFGLLSATAGLGMLVWGIFTDAAGRGDAARFALLECGGFIVLIYSLYHAKLGLDRYYGA